MECQGCQKKIEMVGSKSIESSIKLDKEVTKNMKIDETTHWRELLMLFDKIERPEKKSIAMLTEKERELYLNLEELLEGLLVERRNMTIKYQDKIYNIMIHCYEKYTKTKYQRKNEYNKEVEEYELATILDKLLYEYLQLERKRTRMRIMISCEACQTEWKKRISEEEKKLKEKEAQIEILMKMVNETNNPTIKGDWQKKLSTEELSEKDLEVKREILLHIENEEKQLIKMVMEEKQKEIAYWNDFANIISKTYHENLQSSVQMKMHRHYSKESVRYGLKISETHDLPKGAKPGGFHSMLLVWPVYLDRTSKRVYINGVCLKSGKTSARQTWANFNECMGYIAAALHAMLHEFPGPYTFLPCGAYSKVKHDQIEYPLYFVNPANLEKTNYGLRLLLHTLDSLQSVLPSTSSSKSKFEFTDKDFVYGGQHHLLQIKKEHLFHTTDASDKHALNVALYYFTTSLLVIVTRFLRRIRAEKNNVTTQISSHSFHST